MSSIKEHIRNRKVLFAVAKFFYLPVTLVRDFRIYQDNKKIALGCLGELNALEGASNNIFYFGIPHHLNMGDMAQTYCIRKWIKENYPDANVVEIYTACTYIKTTYNVIKSKIRPENLIIFQSGYTSHEKHPDHRMHLKLVSDFPNNRFLFMPQTVNLTTLSKQREVSRIYGNKPKLTFLCRDPYSFERANELILGSNLKLYPDIVTTLIGDFSSSGPKSGTLLCMRNDYEKVISDETINDLATYMKQFGDVTVSDTTVKDILWAEFISNFEQRLKNMLEEYSRYKLIITDRYHGTIFSVISHTPVVVIPTRDHKVVSGAEWFEQSNIGSVYLAKTTEDVKQKATEIANNEGDLGIYNSYFKDNYYDKLRKLIEEG